ncbi:hypothetical protein KRR26_18415 [Corallococcus sp. M34]|nr:hypothetical protein [Citreicoccus inhibens]
MRMRAFILLVALSWMAGACATARAPRPPGDPAALRYNISCSLGAAPALEVEVVLLPGGPRDFLFSQPGGVDTVWATFEHGDVRALRVTAGGVHVPSAARFLRYRYAPEPRHRGQGPGLFTGMGDEGAFHVAGRAYLLRPRVVTPGLRVELFVEGAEALLPWAPSDGGLYHVRGEDLVDSGFHGFGGRRCLVRLEAATVEVAILGQLTHLRDADVCGWIRQAAVEVATVRHAFPYPRVTVRVVPVPGDSDAGLFGMVLWSSPPSISILVGQDASREALGGDWVAVHEMLHLAHPAMLPHVPWLTEGLATYYTELARARSGRQTAQRAWEELVAGFERGRESAGTRTMAEVVAHGDYMSTYWLGALFALHLDVELRRVSHGTRRLEDVLESLGRQGQTSTLGAFGVAVDAVAGQPLFDSLLARHLPRPAFAELEGLLESLGVRQGPQGVTLAPGPAGAMRQALDGERPDL